MKNLMKISITTLGTLAILGTNALAVTGTVNAPSGLVLRQEASKTANPITTVPDKTEVNIIEKSGEWYKVTYDSHEGYLFAEYVNSTEDVEKQTTDTSTEAGTQQSMTENTQVTNKLKVYNMPLITSTIVNEIEPNAQITIIKQITNWSYVSTGEIHGWVRTYGLEGGTQTTTPEIPSEPEEPTSEKPEEPTNDKPDIGEPESPTEEPDDQTTSSEPSNTAQTESPSTATKGFVAVNSATVRKEATTDSEVVTYLIEGTSFEIKAETEEWYKIKYTDINDTVYEGYIYKQLVTI